MGCTDDYKFLPIRDAFTSINQKVSLMGVILEVGFPRRTRGTDYCCTLQIIDESHLRTGMSVNIFAENSEILPNVASSGDIIQLCHVVIKAHGGEVSAVFNKNFSSFALYKGKDGGDFVPYQISPKFRLREIDRKFIDKLRKWLVNFELREDSGNFSMFREIKEGDHINLVCKLLHCCEAAEDEWMVFVWDGTDTPSNSIYAKLEDEKDNPLPLQLESKHLPRESLCTLPTVGSILRITFDHGIEKSQSNLPNINNWVKFVNMRLEVHAGLWRGVLMPFTKLRYTPNEDSLILERQRLYDERITSQWGRMPFWSFPWPSQITEVIHENVTFVTLMDVLTHSEVTAKFKCVVRVVAVMPFQAENLRSPLGIYRLRLTLEDPTARIHALVYADDGETLFEGYPGIDILTSKVNKLLGVTVDNDNIKSKVAPRNPPWVQVCLKSYYLSKCDVWGSRHYRIFDTKIVGGI